jgi:hypothetical protein
MYDIIPILIVANRKKLCLHSNHTHIHTIIHLQGHVYTYTVYTYTHKGEHMSITQLHKRTKSLYNHDR